VLFRSLVTLPETWFERMRTIAAFGQDASAGARLDAWRAGIQHALIFPVTGVGLDGWRYATVTTDWHNSYVEMMAEQGFIGFGLWCLLLFGTIVSLVRLARTAARSPDLAWIGNSGHLLAASLVAFAAGSMFLGLSYWDILYHLIVISVLLSELARGSQSAQGAEPHAVDSFTARVTACLAGLGRRGTGRLARIPAP
jgi:O-antigen ligase